jgi:hypothetical protein
MNCPDEYSGKLRRLGERESYSSYAECVKVLADAFCDGDETQVVLTK